MDKRHVGMKSSTMEKQALKNALTRIKRVLNVVEVCTDASSTIKKMLGMYSVYHSKFQRQERKTINTNNNYSQFHITLLCHVEKFIGNLGTRL